MVRSHQYSLNIQQQPMKRPLLTFFFYSLLLFNSSLLGNLFILQELKLCIWRLNGLHLSVNIWIFLLTAKNTLSSGCLINLSTTIWYLYNLKCSNIQNHMNEIIKKKLISRSFSPCNSFFNRFKWGKIVVVDWPRKCRVMVFIDPKSEVRKWRNFLSLILLCSIGTKTLMKRFFLSERFCLMIILSGFLINIMWHRILILISVLQTKK